MSDIILIILVISIFILNISPLIPKDFTRGGLNLMTVQPWSSFMRKLTWITLIAMLALSSACKKRRSTTNSASSLVTSGTKITYAEPLNPTGERPILPMKDHTATNTSTSTKTQLQLASSSVPNPSLLAKLPGSFMISSITPGEHKATIEWTPSERAKTYIISRGTSPDNYSTILSMAAISPYTDTNLDNGTTYYYMVSAMNDSGKTDSEIGLPITTPACFGRVGSSSWQIFPSPDSTLALRLTQVECKAFNMACDPKSSQTLCTSWY